MQRLKDGARRAWVALHTIRARLTLWYVALLAIILVAFSAFLYFSLARNLYAEVDQLLAAEAQQIVTSLELHTGPPRLPRLSSRLPAGMVVQLYDPAGEPLAASDAGTAFPLLPTALAQAAQGHKQLETARLADGTLWRVLTRPVVTDGQVVAVLQVARPLRDVEGALRQLVTLMALAIPSTLLLAIAGGLFLAGRALDPIDRITRAAESISAEGLSRRLALPPSPDEVGRLAATFDRMLERLEHAFQRQRQFAADASHELRTPLAMLTTEADLALERPRRAAEYRRVIASMREEAARLNQLLSDLLTLARADAGQETLAREPLALDALADDVVAAMTPLAQTRGVRLERSGDRATVRVLGDQTRLTQLLVNLIDNGLKYTPAGGTVTVAVGREGGQAVVRVVDTGVGIAAEHLPHLFERFYRVDKARSRAEGGAGLGLSICQWIARAHGGEITVASQPGQGTTFTVQLPLAAAPDGTVAPAEQPRARRRGHARAS
jgi:heavy metal sensor kinase